MPRRTNPAAAAPALLAALLATLPAAAGPIDDGWPPYPRARPSATWRFPRPTVLRDTALQVGDCEEVEDGRGFWGGRGPGGARPPRCRGRGRAHARAAAADV